MQSVFCDVVSSICKDYDLLPDELYDKSKNGSTISLTTLEQQAKNELNDLLNAANKKFGKLDFYCNDQHSLLRRVLPRQEEFLEDTARIKEIIAHICISYEVFKGLVRYLSLVLTQLATYKKNEKRYFKHYVKSQNIQDALNGLCREHRKYVNKAYDIINDVSRAWQVELPYPRNLIDMMANAFIDVNNGVLSAPLLRSYMEIHANIILENTINAMLKKFDVDRYSKKKILFQRGMEFSDTIRLLRDFDILNEKDIDIISRIHDYTSKSIHVGSFIDTIVAWYMLFYLQDLENNTPSVQAFLAKFLDEFVSKGKFRVVDENDIVNDYARFQPTSNERN